MGILNSLVRPSLLLCRDKIQGGTLGFNVQNQGHLASMKAEITKEPVCWLQDHIVEQDNCCCFNK